MNELPANPTRSYSGFYFPDAPVKLRSALYAFECLDGSASLSPTRPSRKMYLPLILGGIVIGPVVCWMLVLNWPIDGQGEHDNSGLLLVLVAILFLVCFVGIGILVGVFNRMQVRAHLTKPPLLKIGADGKVHALDDAAQVDRADVLCVRHVRGTVVNELTNNRMAFSQVLLDAGGSINRPVHIASVGGGAYRLQQELEALADWLGIRLVREHCSSDETPSYQTLRAHVTDLQ